MMTQCAARGMTAYAFNCIAAAPLISIAGVTRDAMQKQHYTTISLSISGAKLENNHTTLM
jgi:hypothetical protein